MSLRQHRCPYYLLKITKNELYGIHSLSSASTKLVNSLENEINFLIQKYSSLQNCINKIIDILNQKDL